MLYSRRSSGWSGYRCCSPSPFVVAVWFMVLRGLIRAGGSGPAANRGSKRFASAILTAMLAVSLILLGYLVGAIPTGYLVCRAFGVDLRSVGSGNIGTANAYRAAGKWAFAATLAGDVLKGLAPVLIARLATESDWVVAAVAFAALVGHCWPVYLGFKGGKAVATAAGTAIGLAPWVGVLMFVIWWGVVLASRYTSLAASVLAVAGPVLFLVTAQPLAYLAYAACACVLVLERHRSNVRALVNGSERKFGTRGKPSPGSPSGKGSDGV